MNEDYLKALGRVVVNFSSLELYTSLLIWTLADLNLNVGKCITSEISFRGKVALFSSIYRLKVGVISKGSEIDNLIKELTNAEEDRNDVIHSAWLVDQEGTKVTKYKISAKTKRGLKDNFEDFDVNKLNKVADSINSSAKKVTKLISDYRKLPVKLG